MINIHIFCHSRALLFVIIRVKRPLAKTRGMQALGLFYLSSSGLTQ